MGCGAAVADGDKPGVVELSGFGVCVVVVMGILLATGTSLISEDTTS